MLLIQAIPRVPTLCYLDVTARHSEGAIMLCCYATPGVFRDAAVHDCDVSVYIRNQHAGLTVPVYLTACQRGMGGCLYIDTVESVVLQGRRDTCCDSGSRSFADMNSLSHKIIISFHINDDIIIQPTHKWKARRYRPRLNCNHFQA